MKKIKKIAVAGAVLGCSALLVSNSFANEDSDVNNDHNSTTTTTGSYNPETTTFVNNNASSVLTLKGRIDGNYKVMLKWNPLSSEVENYLLLFSSTNSEPTYPIMEGDKVITIDSNKTETVDWSSKKGVNYYRLGAIDTNGNVTLSNTIKIMMDGNGKPVYDESMLRDNNNSDYKESMDRKPEMGDNHGMDKRPEMKDNKEHSNPISGDNFIGSFLKQDLSSEQLKTVYVTMSYFRKSLEEIRSSTQNKDELNTKIESLKTKLYSNISMYIDESKLEDFKKFINEKTSINLQQDFRKDHNQTSSGNYENQDKMQYFKSNIKPKQGLKDMYIKQLREKYSTLINNIPSEKLSLVLDKINSKIDSITSSDLKQDIKERSLAMLQALAVLINERITDTATGISVEDLLK